jgi:hypothetical protein
MTFSEIEQEMMAAHEAGDRWVTEQLARLRKEDEAAGKYYR